MQRVDLALPAGVLNFPHPLVADDIEFEIGSGRRLVEPDIHAGAPHKEPEETDERRRRPGDLEGPALRLGAAAHGWAAAPVADAKHPDQAKHERQYRGAQ